MRTLFSTLIIGLFLLIAKESNAQACSGNACQVISFITQPNGNQSVKNSGSTSVKVGIKWYFSQCQSMAYWTIAPGQTLNFNYKSHCLPYTANTIAITPTVQPGRILFRNNTSMPLYLFYTVTGNGSVVNFCGQATPDGRSWNPGEVHDLTIEAGKTLTYYFFTTPDCTDNANVKFRGAIYSNNAKGQTIQVN